MRPSWLVPLLLLLLSLTGCSAQPSPGEADPCDGVGCGENGHCAARGDVPECVCDPGFSTQGLSCVADPGPCASNPCGATGKECTAQNGFAVCACPSGFVDQGNGCVKLSACAVNPCGGSNRNVCFEVNGQASCLCNPGYEPVGTSCVPINTGGGSACAARPGGASDDSFEPDECASLSPVYSAAQTHTLSAGDVDWVHLSVTAGHIIEVAISGSSIPLYADLFGGDATTPLAADHSGANNPSLQFVADTTGLVYVRVKAAVAGDTGGYTLTLTDRGVDDFPNKVASAATVAGSSFNGSIQYVNDEDFAKLSVQAGHSYRFTLASKTPAHIAVEVYELNGTTLRKTLDTTIPANTTHLARPRTSGAYLLRARASSTGAPGTFSVTLSDLGADDHGDEVLDADPVNVTASSVSGNFERSDDVDVFTFPVTPNHTYRFTCTQGSRGCIMSMRDAGGVVVAQQTSTSGPSTLSSAAVTAGTWNVAVQPPFSSGAYTYQLEDIAGDDYANSYQTPFGIQLGTPVHGSIELSTDRDVFGVNTVAGRVYRVSCGSPVTNLCSLIVRNPGGTTVATSSGSQDTFFLSPSGGQFTIDVGTYSQTGGLYTLIVTEAGTDDYGDTSGSATAVALGTSKSGAINYQGDVDFFSFETTAGHIYQVKCATSPVNCALRVYDPSGIRLGGYNPSEGLLGVLSTAGGTYKLSVSAYSFGSSTGDYAFTITDVGTDDHPNTSAGAQVLTFGTAANGNVQYIGDDDVFTFGGTAQHIYKVVCNGTAGPALVCILSIRDASGSVVADPFSNTHTNTAYFKAASSQSFSAAVSGYDDNYFGPFQLSVTDEGLDDFGDNPATATPYTVGSPTSGRINYPGDTDVLSFTPTANHIYRLTCTSSSTSMCAISVRDASGTAVGTSSGSGGNRSIQFYAATAQRYTFTLGSSLSNVGDYSFQLYDEGVDDYPNSAVTAPLVTPGSLTGELQYSGDRDFVRFNVTAGKVYSFACPQGQYFYAYLRDSNGTSVKVSTSSFGFVATSSGTYSLETTQAVLGAATGTYSWEFTEGTDDAPDTYVGAPALTLGTVRNGSVDYIGDQDYFAVTLSAGTAYSIVTTGLPVTIAVYQADGTTSVGSPSSQTRSFTPTVSGTYYLKLYNATGTGSYTVKVQ